MHFNRGQLEAGSHLFHVGLLLKRLNLHALGVVSDS